MFSWPSLACFIDTSSLIHISFNGTAILLGLSCLEMYDCCLHLTGSTNYTWAPLPTLNHMSLLFLCPTTAMDSQLPGLLRKHNSDLPAFSLLGLSQYDFLKPFILNQPLCLSLHYNLSYLSGIYVLSSPMYYKLWEGKAFVWCICIAVNLQNITMFNAVFWKVMKYFIKCPLLYIVLGSKRIRIKKPWYLQ